jgi:hypothetical protein
MFFTPELGITKEYEIIVINSKKEFDEKCDADRNKYEGKGKYRTCYDNKRSMFIYEKLTGSQVEDIVRDTEIFLESLKES